MIQSVTSLSLYTMSSTSSSEPSNRHYQPVSIESGEQDASEDIPNHGDWKLFGRFWLLGLLNNSSYVIMLACAKSISEGGTALVFLANVLPSLGIKASAPYWFDHVSYDKRLRLSTICMMLSFFLVAIGSHRSSASDSSSGSLGLELFGVAFGSTQSGLGEASLLALAGITDGGNPKSGSKGQCLTSYSSGTGMAGVFGFFWKWFFNDWLGLALPTTLLLANGLAVAYWTTFAFAVTHQPSYRNTTQSATSSEDSESLPPTENQSLTSYDHVEQNEANDVTDISEMSGGQRFRLVLSLWPYIIPLFVVYAAEYALQSGTWTAIGFPVEDADARDRFFEYSNWLYQAGVFLSRSSGTLFTVPMAVLWLMPALQTLNLGIFGYAASNPANPLYHPAIFYSGAFYTGLLGGAVYISGYKRICQDLPLAHREFSLSTTSVAESLGIVVADISGLVIQSCLYEINNLEGALLTCPMKKF